MAIESLPAEEQEYLRPERASIAGRYCGFPDINWPCYGQWGGGTWQQLTVDAAVPESVRWLRIILHGVGSEGAIWYDDVEVVRMPP